MEHIDLTQRFNERKAEREHAAHESRVTRPPAEPAAAPDAPEPRRPTGPRLRYQRRHRNLAPPPHALLRG